MQREKMEMRRVLLFLPLVLLPFLAAGFYALGGGGVVKGASAVRGINPALPDAQLKQAGPKDKLGIYELADKDSLVKDEGAGGNGVGNVADRLSFEQTDPKAKEIREKLAMISKQVNSGSSGSGSVVRSSTAGHNSGGLLGSGCDSAPVDADRVGGTAEVSRLEKMMRSLQQQSSNGEDPEMRQLNMLMDKILEAQNPGRVKEGAGDERRDPGPVGVHLVVPDSLFRTIPAVIEGKQKVAEGSSVKMRLLDTMIVNGEVIPKGSLVWGLASVSNQRLLLEINNIGLGYRIIPVSLTVFDRKDAMPGIDAPEALIADAAGSGANNALQGMQFMGMDQSLGVQAAGAGITVAKSLFSKQVRKIRVKLRAGYPLLLRDNTRKLK